MGHLMGGDDADEEEEGSGQQSTTTSVEMQFNLRKYLEKYV